MGKYDVGSSDPKYNKGISQKEVKLRSNKEPELPPKQVPGSLEERSYAINEGSGVAFTNYSCCTGAS